MKEITEIFKSFENSERNNDVYNVLLKKIPFWTYIRPTVLNQVVKKNNLGEGNKSSFKFKLDKLIKTTLIGIRDLIRINRITKIDYLFFESSRRISDKEPYCSQFYEIIEKDKYMKLCYSERWSYDEEILYLNFFKGIFYFISIIMSPFSFLTFKQCDVQRIKNTISDIQEDLRIPLKRKYFELLFWYFFFTYLIKKSKPAKVFFVSNTFFIPLIAVCEKYNVETMEIQHGVISTYSVNYNFSNLNRKYFFADNLLLLGSSWLFVNSFIPSGSKTIVIGNNILSKQFSAQSKKSHILFISQKIIRKYLIKFIVTNCDILKNELILFKLHPREFPDVKTIQEDLSGLSLNRLNIITNEKSLDELLIDSKLNIGCYSMALIEGVQMNIPTIVINSPLSKVIDFLVFDKLQYVSYNDKLSELPISLSSENALKPDYFSSSNIKALEQIVRI
ncbi:MAG: hypothetical protein LBR30_00145 [Clostridioides sp.]|jgi:hypothetical protein|nr:hypothetical protein [Clostridioides sp.]